MSDSRLEGLIQRLEGKTYLDFSEYMEYALYHPKWGYYMQDPSPVGRDFVTAPMLSPVFSQAILRWVSRHQAKDVIEIGAGSGILAKQLLQRKDIGSYSVLDKNPKASKHIQDKRCQWIQDVGERKGVLIANELLDALPFRRFCIQDDGLYEFVIGRDLKVKLIQSEAVLPDFIQSRIASLPSPYIFEFCDYHQMFKIIGSFKGKMLLIDYGYEEDYFHPDRSLGTMMCYQKHHSIPFSIDQTGLMDITCAVNWPWFIEVAKGYGFELIQLGPQSDFILAMTEDIDHSALKLLHEHEMGQFIKVAELSKL